MVREATACGSLNAPIAGNAEFLCHVARCGPVSALPTAMHRLREEGRSALRCRFPRWPSVPPAIVRGSIHRAVRPEGVSLGRGFVGKRLGAAGASGANKGAVGLKVIGVRTGTTRSCVRHPPTLATLAPSPFRLRETMTCVHPLTPTLSRRERGRPFPASRCPQPTVSRQTMHPGTWRIAVLVDLHHRPKHLSRLCVGGLCGLRPAQPRSRASHPAARLGGP